MPMRRSWKIKAGLMGPIFLLVWLCCCGQSRKYPDRSFRMTIDNDFLNYRGRGTDRFYTNGIQLEYSYPKTGKRFLADKLFLHAESDSQDLAHWGLTQLMFTPDNISDSSILENNRPYAGALFVTRGFTAFSSSLNLVLHSEINIGVIGPLSFAKNTQIWMHKMINYTKPKGWKNQIRTDIVLNYNINVDKPVYCGQKLQSNIELKSRVGTLFNDLGFGFGIKAGKLQPHTSHYQNNFTLTKRSKKTQSELYFFSKGELRLVLGNSLLQGGFIHSYKNDGSDFYHIAEDDIKRLVSILEMGIVINKSRMGFSFSQNFISAEFKTTKAQLFGRLSLIYRFG